MDVSVAQVLGFVSFGLGISTFYQKDDRRLKVLMLVFNLNHLLHFLLLGSVISAAGALLSAIRTSTAIYTSSYKVAMAFVVASIAMGSYLVENWWDWIPMVGTVIGTISVFCLSGIAMRVGFLVGAFLWLANNILVGSIGGTLLEATLIAMNLITISRLVKDRRPSVNEQ